MRTVTKKIVEGTKVSMTKDVGFKFFLYDDEGVTSVNKETISEIAKEYGVSEKLIADLARNIEDNFNDFADAVIDDLSTLWLRMDEIDHSNSE